MDSCNLDLPNLHTPVVNVHPLPLFTLLNHHGRREPGQDRVRGGLLGTVDKLTGVIEITDAFGVYFTLRGNKMLGKRQSVSELYEMHRHSNSKEILVGWYSTWTGGKGQGGSAASGGSGGAARSASSTAPTQQHIDDETCALHHDFFNTKDADFPNAMRPYGGLVHLLVDVSLQTPHVGVYAYRPTNNPILKKVPIGNYNFFPLRVNLVASAEERVGLDAQARAAYLKEDGLGGSLLAAPLLDATRVSSAAPITEAQCLGEARDLVPDSHALELSLKRLKGLLDSVAKYCEEVASGAREGDEGVGRAITDTLAAVPPFDADVFKRTFGRTVQDLLLVTYLANLTQAQMKLAEKISQL